MNDIDYMQMALELAKRALGKTAPNPMVGAIVVKDGQIVGQGYHLKAGTPHAEVHALRDAGEEARGATIYVTLEPCSHYGKTPPCTKAIIESGISRVVAAMSDPNPQVAGKGFEQLRQAGITVEIGLLEQEARELNEVFIKFITTRKPFLVMKTAMTLDGKIATKSGNSKWVTGEEARLEVHRLRDRYDAIMVGIGTVLADDPSLTTRIPAENGRDPIRIIVDSQGRTPLQAKVLTQLIKADTNQSEANARKSLSPTIIALTKEAPQEKVRELEQAGAWVMQLPTQDGRVNLEVLLEELGREEVSSILLEGGGELNAAFLKADLVDKVVTFIAPKLLGGKSAPGSIGGEGPDTMSEAVELERVKVQTIGKDIMVEGYLKK